MRERLHTKRGFQSGYTAFIWHGRLYGIWHVHGMAYIMAYGMVYGMVSGLAGQLAGSPSDVENSSLSLVREMEVVAVAGIWAFRMCTIPVSYWVGWSELQSLTGSGDGSGDSGRDLHLRMLRTPVSYWAGWSELQSLTGSGDGSGDCYKDNARDNNDNLTNSDINDSHSDNSSYNNHD